VPRRAKRSKQTEPTASRGASGGRSVAAPACLECGHESARHAVYCAQCGYLLAGVPAQGWRHLLPLVVVAAGLLAYANSFDKAFVFDDQKQIIDNPRLRDLSDLSAVMGSRRPITDLTFALNYQLHGLDVTDYHVINVTVHILAALILFGIVRRTLMLDSLRGRFGRAAPWLAVATALIWVVHPLQTQSVTYLIQRAESLMGMFYLLTVYCVLRGATSTVRWPWYLAGVAACALGMGSKAVMVTAPLAVLLYDRAYLSRSWGALVRRRWVVHVLLLMTWSVLLVTNVAPQVLRTSNRNATVGFGVAQFTPMQYLATQPGVIIKYLKLSVWPASLCIDYAWNAPVAPSDGRRAIQWGQVVLPGAVVCALLLLTFWLLVRRPAVGFVCAWFFLVLAPTSSFIPIKDPIFEHRMYVSLVSVAVVAVVAVFCIVRDLTAERPTGPLIRAAVGTVLCVMVTVPLVAATRNRNEDYQSKFVMWQDAVSKRPDNPRAYLGVGVEWFQSATAYRPNINLPELEQAGLNFREAVTLDPNYGEAWYNLGNVLFEQGKYEESADAYERSLAGGWSAAALNYNYGNALKLLGRLDEAIQQYRLAIQLDPTHTKAHVNMGNALLDKGDTDAAIEMYREALAIDANHFMAYFNLGGVLMRQKSYAEAIEAFDRALAIDPNHYKAEEIRRSRKSAARMVEAYEDLK